MLSHSPKCFKIRLPSDYSEVVLIDLLKPAIFLTTSNVQLNPAAPTEHSLISFIDTITYDYSIPTLPMSDSSVSPFLSHPSAPSHLFQTTSDSSVPLSLYTPMQLHFGRHVTFHSQPAVKFMSHWVSI